MNVNDAKAVVLIDKVNLMANSINEGNINGHLVKKLLNKNVFLKLEETLNQCTIYALENNKELNHELIVAMESAEKKLINAIVKKSSESDEMKNVIKQILSNQGASEAVAINRNLLEQAIVQLEQAIVQPKEIDENSSVLDIYKLCSDKSKELETLIKSILSQGIRERTPEMSRSLKKQLIEFQNHKDKMMKIIPAKVSKMNPEEAAQLKFAYFDLQGNHYQAIDVTINILNISLNEF